jgi:two-component system, NtrC family, sensor histidine kinase HydH
MFRVRSTESDRTLRMAIVAVLALSVAALLVTVWVMVDFLAEQEIVHELIEELPADAKGKAESLEGELRWQFRLSMLIVLNLVVTGFAVVLLSRAYRSSQKSLRDVKILAADILSSVDQAVLTTDKSGVVTSINQRGMELLATTDRCVGQPLAELSSEYQLEKFRQDPATNGEAGTMHDFEVTSKESRRTVRGFCHPLQNFEGNEIGNVLQLRDVTERVLVDDRLRRMERYMGLGSLAAGLHHEIKNPLAALSLHVQLLEEQMETGETTSEVQKMLAVIKAEVTRVGGVLEGFRDFASIDELNLELVDLKELVRRQVDLLKPRARQAQIAIHVEHTPDLPEITADCIRLEQVLLNLLLNAIDAMPDGGSVTIRTETTGDGVKIQVCDTGCGIPTDLQDRILDPYFTTKSDGTGLGLALCEKIMRQHNGSLDFRSTDTGTAFELLIPGSRHSATDIPQGLQRVTN